MPPISDSMPELQLCCSFLNSLQKLQKLEELKLQGLYRVKADTSLLGGMKSLKKLSIDSWGASDDETKDLFRLDQIESLHLKMMSCRVSPSIWHKTSCYHCPAIVITIFRN